MFPVVALKSVRLSDFNGVSLSALASSTILTNPDLPEAHQLKGWYDHHGKDQDVTSLSSRNATGSFSDSAFLTFRQIKELNQLGQQEKPDYFSCKGMIVYLKKENCLYTACPSQDCNKKVNDDGTGNYFCEKCGKSYPSFKYRVIMKLNCVDYLDNCWLDTFHEGGSAIVGMDGQKLGELREQDAAQFDNIMQEAYFKEFIFRVRAKVDTYNDEQRLRCSCVTVQPVNYATETKRLIKMIKELSV
ncbi:PREDICTED: replication protein A 70 kDa DNA-binding subunit-like [Amphimedon queenslandica]|uniref:Replication factor A C-terminal domain-containing protein n=1 Tax=Amphimedon queenslandica TaxID=400682 RepID=A0A1X7SV11_AMPQE|nr:PREDICTED: replication protein A 70 kDa DNA-binding subunit-like [Amphimedon queenslandica]|eukprot:XP_003391603.2 PREDICTED: replication protein A 70 kDa DNA-binding subunit-like [Amphimedon queenslandica]